MNFLYTCISTPVNLIVVFTFLRLQVNFLQISVGFGENRVFGELQTVGSGHGCPTRHNDNLSHPQTSPYSFLDRDVNCQSLIL